VKVRNPLHSFVARKVQHFYDFADLVPYRDIVNRFIVDHYGCTHAWYVVQAPPTDVLQGTDLALIQKSLSNLIDKLPPEIIQIQFQFTNNGDYREMILTHDTYRSGLQIPDWLRNNRCQLLLNETAKRGLQRSTTIMVLSCLPRSVRQDGTKSRFQVFEEFQSNTGADQRIPCRRITKTQFSEAVASLVASEDVVRDNLERSKLKCSPMSSPQIADYLYKLFQQELAWDVGLALNYDYDTTPLNDAWICSDTRLGFDHVQIGAYKHGIVSFNQKPRTTRPGAIDLLTTGLGFSDFRYIINLRKLETAEEVERLISKRDYELNKANQLRSLIDLAADRKRKPDQFEKEAVGEAKQDIEEANLLVAQLRERKDYLVLMQAGVHFWARDESDFNRRRAIICSKIGSVGGARPWIEKTGLRWAFTTLLPGSVEQFNHPLRVQSRMAADLIPLRHGFEGHGEPICLMRNSSGGLASIDLLSAADADASMALVSGAVGSGKTTAVNYLTLQHLVHKPLLFAIDVGGGFEAIIKLLGGSTIKFREETPFCFNPFQIYGTTDHGVVKEPDETAQLRILRSLEPMIVSSQGENVTLGQKDVTLIVRAIQTVFAQARDQGKALVRMSDFVKLLEEDYKSDSAHLADYFRLYCKGFPLGPWIDGPTQVDLSSQHISFDFQGIKQNKRLAYVMGPLTINYLHDRILENKAQLKVVLADELPQLIANAVLADYIYTSLKNYRKENTMVLLSTQSIGSDIAANPKVSSAVLQNVESWFLLNQGSGNEIAQCQEFLTLTDGQVDILQTLQRREVLEEDPNTPAYRECLYLRGKGESRLSGRLRIQLTPHEYWIVTSYPTEVVLRQRTTAHMGGDLFAAISFLAEKYPAGLRAKAATHLAPEHAT